MTTGPLPPPDDPGLLDRARRHAALGDPVRLAIVEALLDGDLAPDEVAVALSLGTNALAHHLKVLAEAGLVRRQRSAGDGRRRYLSARTDQLEPFLDPRHWRARSVLFVCTGNAARSQLATAIWSARSDVPATSAGRRPADRVHAAAVATARAHGLSLKETAPRSYDAVAGTPGLVISVCDLAREAAVPFAVPRLHWSVADPAHEDVGDAVDAAFEVAFADLEQRICRLAPRVTTT